MAEQIQEIRRSPLDKNSKSATGWMDSWQGMLTLVCHALGEHYYG
jgi:hypothetical protein